jgi:hypothetical protein
MSMQECWLWRLAAAAEVGVVEAAARVACLMEDLFCVLA